MATVDDTIISKMDKLLSLYYKSMGINDYLNNNNKGKFFLWCDIEEYQDDAITDDLAEGYENCEALEFDDNFPVNPSITNIDDKRKAIFEILQKYYKQGTVMILSLVIIKKLKNHI